MSTFFINYSLTNKQNFKINLKITFHSKVYLDLKKILYLGLKKKI